MLWRVLLAAAVCFQRSAGELLDLGGKRVWTFHSDGSAYAGKAYRVPGDVYGDLQSLGHIDSILYGENDQAYRWVARLNWTYERLFTAPAAFCRRSLCCFTWRGWTPSPTCTSTGSTCCAPPTSSCSGWCRFATSRVTPTTSCPHCESIGVAK